MKPSNFHVKIGNREVHSIWGIILAILIAIPVLALVGVILSVVFSVVGVIITIALGIALIAMIIGLLSLLIPKKWRDKLGIHINFNHLKKSSTKSTTSSDGSPIIDVDFKEDK